MPNRKKIDKPVLVVVEGLDYLHFLLNSPLKDDAKFQDNVLLWDFKEGGISLSQFLCILRTLPNFDQVRTLGVMCDAEQNRAGMADSIRYHLGSNGFVVPSQEGVTACGQPTVSYLILPHDEPSGCIEHACLKAAAKQELVHCAEAFLACADGGTLNENWQAKLKVHAMIAGCGGNPAMTFGQSAATNLWRFDHPSLAIALNFVRDLAEM